VSRIAKLHALPDLLVQTLHHAREPMTRQDRERFFVDCLFVMKTRKQDLQQILANLTDSALGGEIVGVRVVHAPYAIVGSKNILHHVTQSRFHPEKTKYIVLYFPFCQTTQKTLNLADKTSPASSLQ
jgi:hypothetical protein